MTLPDVIVVLVVVAVVLLVFVAALAAVKRSTSVLLVHRRAKRVLVTLKSGEAFAGLLHAVDADALVLREAEALAYGAKAENVAVTGELILLRADVSYIQLP